MKELARSYIDRAKFLEEYIIFSLAGKPADETVYLIHSNHRLRDIVKARRRLSDGLIGHFPMPIFVLLATSLWTVRRRRPSRRRSPPRPSDSGLEFVVAAL